MALKFRDSEKEKERDGEARFVVKPRVTMNASCRPDKNLVDFLCVCAPPATLPKAVASLRVGQTLVESPCVAELTRRDISLD